MKFHFIRDDGTMQFLRTDNSVEGAAYKGIFETRYLGLTKEYLLDIVELKSNEEHTYDYLLHSLGTLSAESFSLISRIRAGSKAIFAFRKSDKTR